MSNNHGLFPPLDACAAAGLTVIIVDPAPLYSQARTHRRRRVNKKYLKRYGLRQTGEDYFLGNQIIFDEMNRRCYCHRHVAAQLEREMVAATKEGGNSET
jgi:hypothetical protein